MQRSLGVWGSDLDEIVDAAVRAEAAGFHRLWSSELHRSPFVPLAAIAGQTSTIGLGTGIALAFVRSPFSTALAALDLDEWSDGRLTLGLGTGVKRLIEDWHDAPFDRPATRLRDTITGIRTVVADADRGVTMAVDGDVRPMKVRGYQRPYEPRRRAIPIHIAAVGPMMTRLAGEVADGWLSHELTSPKWLTENALPWLTEGLDKGGRDRADLTVVASACCAIDENGAAARRRAAHTVAFYASVASYADFFSFHGFGDEAAAVRAAFPDRTAMAAAVPDAMVDAFCLAGTADEVVSALGRYDGLVDEVKLSPPTYHGDLAAARADQSAILSVLAPLTVKA